MSVTLQKTTNNSNTNGNHIETITISDDEGDDDLSIVYENLTEVVKTEDGLQTPTCNEVREGGQHNDSPKGNAANDLVSPGSSYDTLSDCVERDSVYGSVSSGYDMLSDRGEGVGTPSANQLEYTSVRNSRDRSTSTDYDDSSNDCKNTSVRTGNLSKTVSTRFSTDYESDEWINIRAALEEAMRSCELQPEGQVDSPNTTAITQLESRMNAMGIRTEVTDTKPGISSTMCYIPDPNLIDEFVSSELQQEKEKEVKASDHCAPSEPLFPPMTRKRPKKKEKVFVEMAGCASWKRGRVAEVIVEPDHPVKYKIKFHYDTPVVAIGKGLAYRKRPKLPLAIGSRVIACRERAQLDHQNCFYPGVILESPKIENKNRYLIFFDGGDILYVKLRRIRVVCESSENVWDDTDDLHRDFIRSYFEEDQDHDMVEVKPGDRVKAKINGEWRMAEVVQLYCSTAKVRFEDGGKEWILRNAKLLTPMPIIEEPDTCDSESASNASASGNTSTSDNTTATTITIAAESTPTTRTTITTSSQTDTTNTITTSSDTNTSATPDTAAQKRSPDAQIQIGPAEKRSDRVRHHSPTPPIYNTVRNIHIPRRLLVPKKFPEHHCGPGCIKATLFGREMVDSLNLLAIPLLNGWGRKSVNVEGMAVMYTAPCGRRIFEMEGINRYLLTVGLKMTLNMFNFDIDVHPLAAYVHNKDRILIPDLSYGTEKIKIAVFNDVDNTVPECFCYSTQYSGRSAMLSLRMDPQFLPCCDCEDDCSDKTRCLCRRISMEPVGKSDPDEGYQYCRLRNQVETGIVECNRRCRCLKNCFNRVAQNGLQVRLEVFKTSDKGWGVRCLYDIPEGTFICTYAGELLSSEEADDEGTRNGDEYFVDLDHHKVIGKPKEGYESQVEDFSDDDYEKNVSPVVARWTDGLSPRFLKERTTERIAGGGKKSRFSSRWDADFTPWSPSTQSTSSSRDPNQPELFVVNAKHKGNVARFFNHSCNPNMFVQYVFIDTHDLRFPTIAFFASKRIPAGHELTWDYGYRSSGVPGKKKHCKCGSQDCRGCLI